MNDNSLYGNEKQLLAQVGDFFNDLWETIVRFFNSYQWQEILFALKFILLILSILMLITLIIVWFKKLNL
jgi:hypothetical protein